MEIATRAEGTLATLAVGGTIDTRAANEFEAELVKAVEAGARQVIIDFTRVDLITSAGIRVLVLFAKRLNGIGGGFALCCLSADVRRVFDISGLSTQFRIAATVADAAAALNVAAPAAARSRGSRVARLVGTLLGGADGGARAEAAEKSPLSRQVESLLAQSTEPPRR